MSATEQPCVPCSITRTTFQNTSLDGAEQSRLSHLGAGVRFSKPQVPKKRVHLDQNEKGITVWRPGASEGGLKANRLVLTQSMGGYRFGEGFTMSTSKRLPEGMRMTPLALAL